MTPTAEGMAQLHEIFLAMTAGGFTEKQACTILGVMIATQQVGGGEWTSRRRWPSPTSCWTGSCP